MKIKGTVPLHGTQKDMFRYHSIFLLKHFRTFSITRGDMSHFERLCRGSSQPKGDIKYVVS